MSKESEPRAMRSDDKKGVLIWCTDGSQTGREGDPDFSGIRFIRRSSFENSAEGRS